MTGQSLSDVEHLIIPKDRVPVAAYQAIYHRLTSKVERLSQVFKDTYHIYPADITQLDTMLNQAVMQYPVQGLSSSCIVNFKSDEKLQCSSIDKFRIASFSTSKPTESIEYSFDFFSVLPVEIEHAREIVQRFKVSVLVDQDFVEDAPDSLPYFIRGISGDNISLKIEYSDFAVGRNFQTTVQDWVNTLKCQKIPTLFKKLEGRSDFLGAFVPLSFLSSCLFGFSKFSHSDKIDEATGQILLALCISVISYIVGRFLVVQLYRQLSVAKPLTFLHLTRGDEDRFCRMQKKRTRKAFLASFFGITIFVGIAVNILSSVILEALK